MHKLAANIVPNGGLVSAEQKKKSVLYKPVSAVATAVIPM